MGCLAPFRIMVSGLNPMDDHQFPPFKNSSDHKLRVTPHFWTTQISSLVHMWFQIHYIYIIIYLYIPYTKNPSIINLSHLPFSHAPALYLGGAGCPWVSRTQRPPWASSEILEESPRPGATPFFRPQRGSTTSNGGYHHTPMYIYYIYSIV